MLAKLIISQCMLAGLATCVPIFSGPENSGLFPRDDDDFDFYDLSHVQKIAAIGDSYSAGIGAGARIGRPLQDPGAWGCSRYNNSYPSLVNHLLFGADQSHFQFHACSGATTQEVIDEQVKLIDNDQDVILVSASGNDAELIHILNHCVFQWFSVTSIYIHGIEKMLEEIGQGESIDWIEAHKGKLARTCDEQLDESEKVINSKEFSDRIGTLIDKSKEKLKKDSGVIYYTGYAKFWGEDMQEDDFCSRKENAWSFIYTKADWLHISNHPVEPLSKTHREKMNHLVELVNQKIESVVKSKAENDNVVFVNYDPYLGDIKGRFCTKGNEANTRLEDLAFYPFNIKDPMGSDNFKRDEAPLVYVKKPTFEGEIEVMARLAMKLGLQYNEGVPLRKAATPKPIIASNALATQPGGVAVAADDENELRKRGLLSSVLPNGYGRVFHPTILGHAVIAKLIYWHLAASNGKRQQKVLGPEVVEPHGACPVPEFAVPQCEGESDMYTYVFVDSKEDKSLVDDFCHEIDTGKLDQTKTQEWTVDITGQKQSSQRKRATSTSVKLTWTPANMDKRCTATCKQAYRGIATTQCGAYGSSKNEIAKKGSLSVICGTYAYEIFGAQKVPDAKCLDSKWSAPRGDREIQQSGAPGTSVDAAYERWCEDVHDKTVGENEYYYARWGVSELGVKDRHSFWLRANYTNGEGCSGKGRILKEECLEVLRSGMETCSPGQGFTHGIAGTGVPGRGETSCVEYALEVGDGVREGSPPWYDHVVHFPPPVDAARTGGQPGEPICRDQISKKNAKASEIEDIANDWCNRFGPITTKGVTIRKGNINLGTWSAVNQYSNQEWCNGFDEKNKRQDDCRYAIRKGLEHCNPGLQEGPFTSYDFVYRCVYYRLEAR